jgi:hypothetical protein
MLRKIFPIIRKRKQQVNLCNDDLFHVIFLMLISDADDREVKFSRPKRGKGITHTFVAKELCWVTEA